ncbi:DUF4257 domain-containing protein [Agromyces humi]|uniref:DUF4257 domain-containing protein n=1 Tax=Agromyces humi TaxID=1766800 RepID=UPI00135CB840|nr:DUF4257 domain-containing protein [Agromyces humi]
MIAYGTTPGMWAAYGIAVVLGAIGGLVAELMLRGQAGQLEKPRPKLKNFWDLGFWANIIIGAAAAAGFLLFLPPETIGTGAKAHQIYRIEALVSTSLIVGTVGGAILAAMAERVKAAISGEKARDVKATSIATLESLLKVNGKIPDSFAPDFTVDPKAIQTAIDQIKAIDLSSTARDDE